MRLIIWLGAIIFLSSIVTAKIGYDNPTLPKIELAIQSIKTFLGLTDTPNSYSGQGGKCIKVGSSESGLEFGDCSGGQFSGPVLNQSFFLGGGRTGQSAESGLVYLSFFGDGAPNNNFNAKRIEVPFDFKITNMRVSKLTGGVGVNYTLYLNGNPTNLKCRTTGALATCRNLTESVDLIAGDFIALGMVSDDSAVSFGNLRFSFEGIRNVSIIDEKGNNTILYINGLKYFSGLIIPGSCPSFRSSNYIPAPFSSSDIGHNDNYIVVDSGNITRFSTSLRIKNFNNSGNVTGAFLNYTFIINDTTRVFVGRQSFDSVNSFSFVNRTINYKLNKDDRVRVFYEWEIQNNTGRHNNQDFCYDSVYADWQVLR